MRRPEELRAVEWAGDSVRIIDQTLLPGELRFVELRTVGEVAEAICTLRVRGAPAIGVVAALGVALAAQGSKQGRAREEAQAAIQALGATRPTAVNLPWALARMSQVLDSQAQDAPLREALLREATCILTEDVELCRRIGQNGESLLTDGATVLTHCNAGALATAGMGTALAAVYAAVDRGKRIKVIAAETRPLLQGARLTAWELVARSIDVTVICDSASAWVMKRGMVDYVLVGADRVALNGDLANKVGSYSLSIAAREHAIPFYAACPYSTIDRSLQDGSGIPVEERGEEEVRSFYGRTTIPRGARVFNPAFDVVPNTHVSAIITEKGVFRPPYEGKLGE